MEKTGVVKEIKESLALVQVRLCPGQEAGRSLSFGLESSGLREIWAINQANARPGDYVELSLPESKMRATLLAFYVLPLCSLLVGALLGKWAENQKPLFEETQRLLGKTPAVLLLTTDNSCLVFGILFLLASFLVLRQWHRRLKAGGKLQALLVRIVEGNDGQAG